MFNAQKFLESLMQLGSSQYILSHAFDMCMVCTILSSKHVPF